MSVRYLGFVLLIWIPQLLHAQSATRPCPAPSLSGGYLVPEHGSYPHATTLTYACDNGRKPAVEGWWATSTCQNGKWSHKPQCIGEKACVPPTIPNAKYTASKKGWYEERDKIRTTCDEGYEHKGHNATAQCINGTWSSLPVCQKSTQTCGAPPKSPHAVVILQEYKEVFPVDTRLHYECENGYTAVGVDTEKNIFCIAGNWTEGPTCSRITRPDTGHGGSAGGGHTSGSGTHPVGGGSSGSSKIDEKETEHQITTVTNCGSPPVVRNGDVVINDIMFLEYQCANFYKRVGPERVHCYSDGMWSDVPTCKVAFCSVDTNKYFQLKPAGVKYIKDGETANLECVQKIYWVTDHYSVAECTNGRMSLSKCCGWAERNMDICSCCL